MLKEVSFTERAKRAADNLARVATMRALQPGSICAGERYEMGDDVLVVEARYHDGQIVIQWLLKPIGYGAEARGRGAYEAACRAIAAHLQRTHPPLYRMERRAH